jgi:hypothetical protein
MIQIKAKQSKKLVKQGIGKNIVIIPQFPITGISFSPSSQLLTKP